MEQKKQTAAQLRSRLENALIHVDKDKDTKSIFFDDKGLRVTITNDFAIIATGAHQHVFSMLTNSGISRPWIYTQRFVEIALKNDCTIRDEKGNITRSYAKLMDVLKKKDDKVEYNIAWFYDLWLFNIFAPLYSIGESDGEAFIVYEQYMHNLARNAFLLQEHKEDVTNLQFLNAIQEQEKEFVKGLEEQVVLQALTDEQRVQQELSAIQETETESAITESIENAEQ